MFFIFFKLGIVNFGGGYALFPLLEREFVTKRKWVTNQELAYYKGAAGVSGDYFDFKKLDDRFYVFVKCDASGHAAPAGILVTIIATLYKKWFETWSFAKNGTKLEEFVYKANDFLESLKIKD